jgi:uncharacterized protein (DUF952 family)
MDISNAEQRQNVQERRFHGHFECGAAPKCPKKKVSWTFRRRSSGKMSKKEGFMDIPKAEQRQNVQERRFNGHFKGGAAAKCPRKKVSWTFRRRSSVKMSKKEGFMDISKAEQRQNVQERRFNGHFKGGAAPKCPRKKVSWTFRRRSSAKMSKKEGLMDISKAEQHQNVQERRFHGHFEGGAAPKCLRKKVSWTFRRRSSTKMSKKEGFMDISKAERRQNV